MTSKEAYDLLIVIDATASMSQFLSSLQKSLPQIISVSALTGCFERIGLLAYRDYCDRDRIEWFGWLDPAAKDPTGQPDLVEKAKTIFALGGGDLPEAAKTALAMAYNVSRAEAITVILFYTDASPHTTITKGANYMAEQAVLGNGTIYGKQSSKFTDWASASRFLRDGDRKAEVFTILGPFTNDQALGYYTFLSTVTGGAAIRLDSSEPDIISKLTVQLLTAWMGVDKAGISEDVQNEDFNSALLQYTKLENIDKVINEDPKNAPSFFQTAYSPGAGRWLESFIQQTKITPKVLKYSLPKKNTPVSDFASRYKTEPEHRALVVEQLSKIINTDVLALSLNPVLGSLWRAVSSDRNNESRDGLIADFGSSVERLRDVSERERMKKWLEESYDFAGAINGIIQGVSEDDRFPCVCLDPTVSFTKLDDVSEVENDDNRPITSFRRDELLEIGRSCDPKILRRLGRVLTSLTYIERASEIPEHIATAPEDRVPRLPMALASEKYGREFWKVLLHLLVPGTMVSGRAAALLAALSLRVGLEPLIPAAEREMLHWKRHWNDPLIPETWNVSCLSLLLDADAAYRSRHAANASTTAAEHSAGLLLKKDRALFENLINFRFLELNLRTTLSAKVGWAPEKTTVPIGPLVVCGTCRYPRSVTIMGINGKCGLCHVKDYASKEERTKTIQFGNHQDDNEKTDAVWVECCVRTCRSQYVVYLPHHLNVRAKCHYCRLVSDPNKPQHHAKKTVAPFVECSQCLSRVIWPEMYRPKSFRQSEFLCAACMAGRKTVVEVETTAQTISAENTDGWLVCDVKNPSQSPFMDRSLHYMVSTIGNTSWLSRIQIFPNYQQPLTLGSKLIRNSDEIIGLLKDRISRRSATRITCSLCFTDFRPVEVSPACGRRGCNQNVCKGCLQGWYGINRAGCIINIAALCCPFCRRRPRGRTLAKHGMGIHAVGDLQSAVRQQGQWIYTWCEGCDIARPYMERECARGMPEELQHWHCDACEGQAEQRRLQEQLQLAIREAHGNRRNGAVRNAQNELDEYLRRNPMDVNKRVKPCPKCGTMTEKVGGCNHITCPVAGCEAHWCYICGRRFDEHSIYPHLANEHGGFFDGADDNDYDYDYDEWH